MGGAPGLASIGSPPTVVTCDELTSYADSVNADYTKTDTAIETSGIGARQPEWLSNWQAERAEWNQLYATDVPKCSAWNPLDVTGDYKPASIAMRIGPYEDTLREYQKQAIAYGIIIPGGVRPEGAASNYSSLLTVGYVVLGVVAVGAVALVLHEVKGLASAA